jgi:predicted TPR repeat methyltransferase
LTALFQEIARIIQVQGTFAFTVEIQSSGQEDSYAINRVEVDQEASAETAVTLFRHSDDYIVELLNQNGFVCLKALDFVAFKYPAENRDVFFRAYVARKSSCT